MPAKPKLYVSRGRTGREGVALKSWGGLVALAGLVWTISVWMMDQAASVYVASIATLLLGALVLRVGFVYAKNSRAASRS